LLFFFLFYFYSKIAYFWIPLFTTYLLIMFGI
jgi:hypothetical protein